MAAIEPNIDVLLVSADPEFCETVRQRCPSSARLRCTSPAELAAGGQVRAQQVWIDLDTAPRAVIPSGPRRVYFYSRHDSVSESLPAGMFIRRPCAPVVLDVLWADTHPATPIIATAPERALSTLPGWLLEFHELRLSVLARKMVTVLGQRLGYESASLYLYNPRSGCLTLAETTHGRYVEPTVPIDDTRQSLMAVVAREGKVFRTRQVSKEAQARGVRRAEPSAYDDETCLIAPLTTGNQLCGVLNLSGAVRTDQLDADVQIDAIVTFLGRALCHAKAYEEARTEARIDSLTGLFNQRWITESVEKEIRRAERFGTALSVLMVDLDNLKTINDRGGHAAGDCVLRHAAQCIGRVLRQFDGAARVGGDEFVVMLPATSFRGAAHVARRLQESLREEPAQFRGDSITLTASIGVAEWRAGLDAARLIELADAAMYRAKQNGGDALEGGPSDSADRETVIRGGEAPVTDPAEQPT